MCWGCLYLPKAEKYLQSQPREPPRRELETGPTAASLGQGLVVPGDLLLPPVWTCLAQTEHNVH